MASYSQHPFYPMEDFQDGYPSQYSIPGMFLQPPQVRNVIEENPVLKDVASDHYGDDRPNFQDLDMANRRPSKPINSVDQNYNKYESAMPSWDNYQRNGSPSTVWKTSDKVDSPAVPWSTPQKNGYTPTPSYGSFESNTPPYGNNWNKFSKNVNGNGVSHTQHIPQGPPVPQMSSYMGTDQNGGGTGNADTFSAASTWNNFTPDSGPVQGWDYVDKGNTQRQQWGNEERNGPSWNIQEHSSGSNQSWSRLEQNGSPANQSWIRPEQNGSPALAPWEEYHGQQSPKLKRKKMTKAAALTAFNEMDGVEDNGINEALPYPCSVCGKSFKFKAFLKLHFQKHTDEKPYSCEFCGKSYSYKSSLQTHRLLHLEPGASYTCDICGIEFNRKQYLAKHKMKDHAQENADKQYSCGSCHKRFLSAFDLKHHVNCQVKEKPFQCSICNKFFSAKNSLKVHEKLHQDAMKSFPCEICGEGFPKEELLDFHRRSHLEGKTYACDICGNTYGYRGQLQRHLKCHKGEEDAPRFKCDLCSQMFRSGWQLQQHESSHGVDISALTDLCDREFPNDTELNGNKDFFH